MESTYFLVFLAMVPGSVRSNLLSDVSLAAALARCGIQMAQLCVKVSCGDSVLERRKRYNLWKRLVQAGDAADAVCYAMQAAKSCHMKFLKCRKTKVLSFLTSRSAFVVRDIARMVRLEHSGSMPASLPHYRQNIFALLKLFCIIISFVHRIGGGFVSLNDSLWDAIDWTLWQDSDYPTQGSIEDYAGLVGMGAPVAALGLTTVFKDLP